MMEHTSPLVILGAVGFAAVNTVAGPVVSVVGGGLFAVAIAYIQFRTRRYAEEREQLREKLHEKSEEILSLKQSLLARKIEELNKPGAGNG